MYFEHKNGFQVDDLYLVDFYMSEWQNMKAFKR
jgi:hypothetical protein